MGSKINHKWRIRSFKDWGCNFKKEGLTEKAIFGQNPERIKEAKQAARPRACQTFAEEKRP